MKEIIKVNNRSQLGSLNDIVHDNNFDRDNVVFDQVKRTVEIPFDVVENKYLKGGLNLLFFRIGKKHLKRYILQISSVGSLEIKGERNSSPGSYEYFDQILYDENSKLVKIITQFIDGYLLKVDDLYIAINDVEKSVGEIISGHFLVEDFEGKRKYY